MLSAFVDTLEPSVARFSRQKRWIAVEREEGDFAFYRASGGNTVFFANGGALDDKQRRTLVAGKNGEIELRLLADQVTYSTFKLPAGGLEYVEQIVQNRLDRLTPWKPEKVLYGFSSGAKAALDGQIDVNFAATSQEIAANSIRRLEAFGLVPSTIGSAAEPISQHLQIDLFRGQNDTVRRTRRKRIAAVSIAICMVLLVGYLITAYAVLQCTQQLAALDESLTAIRNKLVRGTGNNTDRQSDLALISSRTPENTRFFLIDRLAGIIPENTFLDELDIQKDSVRIVGTSTEASALIEIIEAEAALSDAKFSAPVTRQADGRDRFDIMATLVAQTAKAAQ